MSLKRFIKILWASYKLLRSKQPLLLSSATAYFAIFSLAPTIIIVINVFSLYFQQEKISTQLYDRLQSEFGEDTADQINLIVNNFTSQFSSIWITIAGAIFLAFIATTLFQIIRQAINHLWNLRVTKSAKFLYNLKQRSKALLFIFIGGILFIASLLADTAVAVLNNYLDQLIPSVDAVIIKGVSSLVSVFVVTFWFALLFKYLPDASLRKKYALIGGFFTAVLFNIGKYLLGIFLVTDNIDDLFGASASIILLLLFIFYSSLIMYFGAAFTLIFARESGFKINPKKNAERYELSVIDPSAKVGP